MFFGKFFVTGKPPDAHASETVPEPETVPAQVVNPDLIYVFDNTEVINVNKAIEYNYLAITMLLKYARAKSIISYISYINDVEVNLFRILFVGEKPTGKFQYFTEEEIPVDFSKYDVTYHIECCRSVLLNLCSIVEYFVCDQRKHHIQFNIHFSTQLYLVNICIADLRTYLEILTDIQS